MFLKKITIFSLMFFFWFSSIFADENQSLTEGAQLIKDTDNIISNQNKESLTEGAQLIKDVNNWNTTQNTSQQSKSSSKFACEASKDAICSDKFEIDTKLFSPGGAGLNKNSSEKTINWFMTVLIKKLMVALGSLALLIMVVWAWFMIFAMWKDENLNKWKTIFKAWLISLAIALSSYYMVSFLSYILYTTN